jgi:hypothetical protein
MFDWRPTLREKKRLKFLRSRPPGSGLLLEDLCLLLCEDISRWSPDEKAHLRAKLYRRYGLLKGSRCLSL